MTKQALMSFLAAALLLTGSAAAQDTTLPATVYGTLNVRGGPGTRYEIVAQLDAGDQVVVDGRDPSGGWLRLRLDADEGAAQPGWVPVFALLLQGDLMQLPIIPESGASPPLPEDGVTVAAYGLVNVRSGPGLAHPIIYQLDVGDSAAAIGRDSDANHWLYIWHDDQPGWVAYFTVTVSGDPNALPVLVIDGSGRAFVPPEAVITARFNVRLRSVPSLERWDELAVVPFASSVTPLARTEAGDWLYVVYGAVTGWGWARLFDITPQQLEALPVYETLLKTPAPG